MGKALKPKKRFRKNRANQVKTKKHIEVNQQLLKELKKDA